MKLILIRLGTAEGFQNTQVGDLLIIYVDNISFFGFQPAKPSSEQSFSLSVLHVFTSRIIRIRGTNKFPLAINMNGLKVYSHKVRYTRTTGE